MRNAVPTNVTSIVLITVTSTLSIDSENKIERNKMDCYILHMFLLVTIHLFVIVIISIYI